jgi:glycosyltransferase involved in cell wall biosynthesis
LRVLFLHEVGYLEKPIFEMHEFPEQLAARGHEVAFADYPETMNHQTTSRFGLDIQGRVLSGVNLRLYSQTAVLPGVVGRLFAVFLFPFFFFRVLRDFKPDIVVSFAVPTSGWQAAIICKMQKIPLLFRALDVSHKIRRSAFGPFVRSAECFVYRNSTWVSCNNSALREYCLKLGARKDRSSVELPPLDLAHFQRGAQERERFRARLGIAKNAIVIVYMGSFFYFSGLDRVIKQLSKLADKPKLVLIGGGEQEVELRRLIARLELGDYVTLTGFVGFDELPAYLSVADVAINPMLPSLAADSALPNKVLQYMASSLPVVSTSLKGLSSLFHPADGLSLVSSPEEVLQKSVLVSADANLSRMGKANKKLVDEAFEKEKSVSAFEQLLTKVRSLQ